MLTIHGDLYYTMHGSMDLWIYTIQGDRLSTQLYLNWKLLHFKMKSPNFLRPEVMWLHWVKTTWICRKKMHFEMLSNKVALPSLPQISLPGYETTTLNGAMESVEDHLARSIFTDYNYTFLKKSFLCFLQELKPSFWTLAWVKLVL